MRMVQSVSAEPSASPTSTNETQNGWQDLRHRVEQLESQRAVLEQENKSLRQLLERAIEYRQKSHTELVLLLTGLVSKLPINEVGVVVSKLVEHNTNVSQYLATLTKGAVEGNLEFTQPAVLKTFDETKRDLAAAVKPVVEELLKLDTPLETDLLESVITQPESFLSPRACRAYRCFIKGQVPRERIVREFGQEALVLFQDLTTDPKHNPHPKAEEIVLGFRSDLEAFLQQNPALLGAKREQLLSLHQKIQRSKASSPEARSQRLGLQKLSVIIELLHYYLHQNTEAADVIFAQRLPALVDQVASSSSQEQPEEKLVKLIEELLAFIINPDHRQMVINNLGKSGGLPRTLKYVLKLRAEKVPEQDVVVTEFVKHLLPSQKPPAPQGVSEILRLILPVMQKSVLRHILSSDRLRKSDAEALVKATGEALGLKDLGDEARAQVAVPPEVEQRMAWEKIKDMISRRAEAATVAAAIRDRLNAKYDADEIRLSWLALTEADPISLIRIFCHIPYRADGKTDAIARPVIETYVTRLVHEKYAATYRKVVNSLRNMFAAKPDSPTLLNFLTLVRWVDAAAADRLSADTGMAVPAH